MLTAAAEDGAPQTLSQNVTIERSTPAPKPLATRRVR